KYMPVTGGGFQSYDPSSPPPSGLIAATTTDQGVTVPYIIREETGYEDRDQYAIATLFDPGKSWQPWAPQQQWNHKLVIEHGTSCSGGSLAQQQVANAYPGIYQGILPQCSFPDAWSTGQQLADYFVVRHYVEDPTQWAPGVAWTPLDIAAVEGHPNHANSIEL